MMMKFDMHVHSSFSHDGCMSPETLIRAAKKAGLSGVAVTDHNTIAGSRAVRAMRAPDFCVILAAEYSTEGGHCLAYFIEKGAEEERLRRDELGRFFLSDLLAFVRKQGGVLIAAHPFRYGAPDVALLAPHVDGWEVLNARQLAMAPATTALTKALFSDYPGLVSAGSDAHCPGEVGGAYLSLAEGNEESVKAAFLSGAVVCHGLPAFRTYEAWGRLLGNESGLKKRAKGVARLGAFALMDARSLARRARTPERFDPTHI